MGSFFKFQSLTLILAALFISSLSANREVIVDTKAPIGTIVINETPKEWYKNGMFWFGCWSGLCMPLTYAITLGFDLVDTSHPAVKEKLQPFGDGAAVGAAVAIAFYVIAIINENNKCIKKTIAL